MTKSISKILLTFFLVSFVSLGCSKKTPGSGYIDVQTFCEKNPTSKICTDISGRKEMTPADAKITITIYERDKEAPGIFSYKNMDAYNAINTVYATSDEANDVSFRIAMTENEKLLNIDYSPRYYRVSDGRGFSPNEEGNAGKFLPIGSSDDSTTMYMAEKEVRGYQMVVVLLFEVEGTKYYLNLPNFLVLENIPK